MAFQFFGAVASPKISKYFTLADMTKTSQKGDNTPNPTELANLKKLAAMGDELYDTIGPFEWESAFRSQSVQDSLKAGGGGAAAAAQAANKSYHSLGIAGDIIPKTMTAEAYFAKIALNPSLKSRLGEIALKNTVIHLSLATPTKVGVLMYVDKANNYIKYTANQLSAVLSKYKAPIAIGGVAVVAIGAIALYMYLESQKSQRRLA